MLPEIGKKTTPALARLSALGAREAARARSLNLTWGSFQRRPDHHTVIRSVLHGEGYALEVADRELVSVSAEDWSRLVVVAYKNLHAEHEFDAEDAMDWRIRTEGIVGKEREYRVLSYVLAADANLEEVAQTAPSCCSAASLLFDIVACGKLKALLPCDEFLLRSVTGPRELPLPKKITPARQPISGMAVRS